MKKTTSSAAAMFISAAAIAAPLAQRQNAVVPHVPADCRAMRLIDSAAASFNHIMIANVGNAVPSGDWSRIATYAASKLQLNVWTNAVDKPLFPALLNDSSLLAKTFGVKAKFVVFIEDGSDAVPFLVVPGSWCRVNVRHLRAGDPGGQVLCDRICKAILKGAAHACGAGLALDGRSSNCIGTVSLEGLDKAAFSITPDSYFPMLEAVGAIGGDEILSPAISEQ